MKKKELNLNDKSTLKYERRGEKALIFSATSPKERKEAVFHHTRETGGRSRQETGRASLLPRKARLIKNKKETNGLHTYY